MKISIFVPLVTCCFVAASPVWAQPKLMQNPPIEPASLLATLKTAHPRLIASSTTWDTIKARRLEDPALDAFLKRSELEARALLNVPPIPYKKDGKRLLHVSRVVLRRVLLLSLQFHLTGDPALARRAQDEMLSVAAFTDWNPSHFLDTAEMTAAVAFGYDWLYDELDTPTRKTLETAIIEKGLKPGLADKSWMHTENNWNSVCMCGMSLGALVVAEDEPAIAEATLQKTREFNPNGLKVYAPNGVYPEGAMYWGYGTSFQAVLIDALQSALGTDWGLSQSPGFLQSADSLLQTMGPTGAFFDYADGVERPGLEGADYWYAHYLQRPELVRFETEHLRKYDDLTKPTLPDSEADRLMPLTAIWWPGAPNPNAPALPEDFYGPGPTPIASFRSSWNDPNAMFLALKGGHASQSHGHMDAGSFVFESDGVRWARDLGMQAYLSLESKGVDLWSNKQESGRWTVFRLNNLSHNTLTIDGQLHRVDGNAVITHFSAGKNAGAIVDLSPVFAGQASRVTRGFAFRPGSHTLIRDELEGLKAGNTVRWAMVTSAAVAVSTDGQSAVLSQNAKSLRVQLDSTAGAKFEVIPADPPKNDYDEPNPNTSILIVNFLAPDSGKLDYSITLQPGSVVTNEAADPLAHTQLKDWPLAPAQ